MAYAYPWSSLVRCLFASSCYVCWAVVFEVVTTSPEHARLIASQALGGAEAVQPGQLSCLRNASLPVSQHIAQHVIALNCTIVCGVQAVPARMLCFWPRDVVGSACACRLRSVVIECLPGIIACYADLQHLCEPSLPVVR